MTSLGVVFRPQLPPERLRGMARAAEESGLEELWVWEDCFLESGIATAAAALAWTDRLRVGIGLLPVPMRNVAIAAMEAATLHRLFPDRVTLGVGHGVQSWMGQVGARVESPLTLLREHLDAMRALLRGERVTTEGRYVKLDGVALDWPPDTAPPIAAGGEGPRTIKLTGAAADATILVAGTTPDGLRKARALIDEGRAEAGRTGPHQIIVYMFAATGPDAAARVKAEAESWGETFTPDMGAAGDAPAIAEAVARLADAGADTVVLQPTADDPDPEALVRLAAEQIRPLLP